MFVLFSLFRKQLKCYSEEQVENTNTRTAYLRGILLHNKKSVAFSRKYTKNIFVIYKMYYLVLITKIKFLQNTNFF